MHRMRSGHEGRGHRGRLSALPGGRWGLPSGRRRPIRLGGALPCGRWWRWQAHPDFGGRALAGQAWLRRAVMSGGRRWLRGTSSTRARHGGRSSPPARNPQRPFVPPCCRRSGAWGEWVGHAGRRHRVRLSALPGAGAGPRPEPASLSRWPGCSAGGRREQLDLQAVGSRLRCARARSVVPCGRWYKARSQSSLGESTRPPRLAASWPPGGVEEVEAEAVQEDRGFGEAGGAGRRLMAPGSV